MCGRPHGTAGVVEKLAARDTVWRYALRPAPFKFVDQLPPDVGAVRVFIYSINGYTRERVEYRYIVYV